MEWGSPGQFSEVNSEIEGVIQNNSNIFFLRSPCCLNQLYQSYKKDAIDSDTTGYYKVPIGYKLKIFGMLCFYYLPLKNSLFRPSIGYGDNAVFESGSPPTNPEQENIGCFTTWLDWRSEDRYFNKSYIPINSVIDDDKVPFFYNESGDTCMSYSIIICKEIIGESDI